VTLRVLVIDDDARLFDLLREFLGQNDVLAERAPNGSVGLERFEREHFDAIVLDVMMPGLTGLEVLQRIRQKSNVAVLMLTAKGDETDRVVGLELGADDYLAQPFSPRELLARLRAVLRRGNAAQVPERLSAAGIVVDTGTREVTRHGEPISLTGLEFDVLVTLIERAGRVVPRSALISAGGRDDVVVGERAVDVHVSHLRRKLGDDTRQPRLIKTVRGVGYMLSKEDAAGET
jgi:two-component system, OmpR family, response regulator